MLFSGAPFPAPSLQGSLSGGGYDMEQPISDDGLTHLLTYDSGNAFIVESGAWTNLFAQDRVPAAFQTWGQRSNSNPLSFKSIAGIDVCATTSTRIWGAVLGTSCLMWRSDDRGKSWVNTGQQINALLFDRFTAQTNRGFGPCVAADPNNPDVCYVQDAAGAVWRTLDAGATWACLNASGQPLSGILPSSATNGSTSTSSKVLNFASTPSGITSIPSGFVAFATNITNPASILDNTVASTTSTTATLLGNVNATVNSGDTIVFGLRCGIVFDRNSGVDGNGRTKGIYIGWGWGADAVYHSTDAGATFSALNAGTFPAQVARLECSKDGILYAIDYGTGSNYSISTTAWKCVAGTWTNFSITGNKFTGIATDPNNLGTVAFATLTGGLQMSTDYGVHWGGSGQNTWSTRIASDVPWLGPTSITESTTSIGSIKFDPVTNGRLWAAGGIGSFYCTPVYNGSGANLVYSPNWTSFNSGEQGLIVNQICKPPGQATIYVAVQDRTILEIPSVTQEPSGPQVGFPSIGQIAPAWALDFAKDGSGVVAGLINNAIWTKSSGIWAKMTLQPTIIGGAIAAQSANSIVVFSANDLAPGPQYWNGSAWANCLFNGSTLATGWSFSVQNNRHNVVADFVNATDYYAYNYNNNSTGGLWKSTDGGATWTNVTAIGTFTALNGNAPIGTGHFQMVAIPGNAGHLMIAFGSSSGGGHPVRTIDGGSNWADIPNVTSAWQIAPGKALASGYPAIFISGSCSTDPSPTDPGIFIANDVSASSLSAVPTWQRICRAPGKNMTSPRSLFGDLDTYGRFYISLGGVGYAWGQA